MPKKKFWRVDADLPKDKILEAFKNGFTVEGNPNENGNQQLVHETYGRLTVGAAPGGVIVVWLSQTHHRIEICRLQAKEFFVNKDEFLPNPDPDENQEQFFNTFYDASLSDKMKSNISKNGIPFGLWDLYREKYKYRFVLNPYDDKDYFTFQSQQYFNGEATLFYPPYFNKNEYLTSSLPYILNVNFTEYNTEIHFDFSEIVNAFKTLKQKYAGEPIEIVLTPTFMYREIKVSVKCKEEELPLRKAIVKGIWSNK